MINKNEGIKTNQNLKGVVQPSNISPDTKIEEDL